MQFVVLALFIRVPLQLDYLTHRRAQFLLHLCEGLAERETAQMNWLVACCCGDSSGSGEFEACLAENAAAFAGDLLLQAPEVRLAKLSARTTFSDGRFGLIGPLLFARHRTRGFVRQGWRWSVAMAPSRQSCIADRALPRQTGT